MSNLTNFLLPNAPTCIVACSAAEARVWRSTSRFGDWKYVTTMSNPAASKSEADFASDRPGRAFDSVGAGRHSMSQAESGQQHEMLVFARQVADYLNRCVVNREFDHIVLIGAPKFLGCLRTELSEPARRVVVMEAPKNLGDLDSAAIKKYFE